MEHEVEGVVYITLELIIAAIVIGAIAVCAFLGGKMTINKELNTSYEENIQSKTQLYYYDNKMVSGSDSLELMLTYTKNYTYIFIFYDASGNEADRKEVSYEKELESGDYKEFWSEKSLRNVVNGYEKSKFVANIIKDESSGVIQGVKFEYTPT